MMATDIKNSQNSNSKDPASVKSEYNSFKLAIAVMTERIATLPKEDKDCMFELAKIIIFSDSDEEKLSAMNAMDEIMDQRPVKVVPLEFSNGNGALSEWLNFISKQIREARQKAGITQQDLASRTGLTQSHISRLENGEHSPSHVTIEKIAKALGIESKDLDPSL